MRRLFRNERRLLLRSRAAVFALSLYALALFCTALLGARRAAECQTRTQYAESVALAERARWVDASRRRAAGEPTPGFPAWRDPSSVVTVGGWLGAPVTRELPPTAFLASGSLAAAPSSTVVTLRNLGEALDVDELIPPRQLELGLLDPALLLLLVLPMLVVGLGHDLVSSQRAQGTLTLLMLAGVSPWRLALARAGVRGAAIWGTTLVALFPFFLVQGVGLEVTAAFAVATAAFIALWLGLCAVLNGNERDPGAHALAAVGLWVTTSLLLPGLVHAATHLAWPLPARSGDAVAKRAAEVALSEKEHELLAEYLRDHPELAPAGNDEWQRAYLLSLDAQRHQLSALSEERERLRETHALARAVVALLSPGMLFQRHLEDLAGASHRAYRDFEHDLRRFHEAWHARFFEKAMSLSNIGPDEVAALPTLRVRAAPLVDAAPLAGLLTMAALGWAAAFFRLARVKP